MPDDHFGPIDVLVVELPAGALAGDGFERLLALVDREIVRILDLELITKDDDGELRSVDPAALAVPEIAVFAGSSSGLLDADDLRQVGADLAPGATAVVLVYEEIAVLGVLDAWAARGGRVLGAAQITPDDLVAALDAADAMNS